jgi:hypothetical protein
MDMNIYVFILDESEIKRLRVWIGFSWLREGASGGVS